MTLEQTIREACPPSWGQTQWDSFTMLLREWWPEPTERWTERRVIGLALGVADFSAEQAGAALRRLRDAGQKFPPRVPEIANAIHVDRSAPSWTEAHALLFDRPDGVVHARIPVGARPVGEDERWELKSEAMLQRAAEHHEMIAAFVAAFGPRRLAYLPINDPEYGALELERLRVQWEEFVQRADARRREGMPLLTAPLHARREIAGGPRRLDPIAALRRGSES